MIHQVRLAEAFMTTQYESDNGRPCLRWLIWNWRSWKKRRAIDSEISGIVTAKVELDHRHRILQQESAFYEKLGRQRETFEQLQLKEEQQRWLFHEIAENEKGLQELEDCLGRLENKGRRLERQIADVKHQLSLRIKVCAYR